MKDIRVLADNLLALRKQYKAVIEVGEFLDNVAGLEQARQEIVTATEQAKKAKEQAVADAAKAAAELFALKERQDALVAECDETLADANDKAREIIDKAEVAAGVIVAEASEKRKTLERNVAELRGELEKASAAVEAKRQDLAALEKQVADLRAAASSIAASFKL